MRKVTEKAKIQGQSWRKPPGQENLRSRNNSGLLTPVAECGDSVEMLGLRRGVLAFEGGGAVLEELLLPEAEQRGRELELIAEIRTWSIR